MKKTTLFFTFLMLGLGMMARSYAPMTNDTYIAPEYNAMVTPASPSIAVASLSTGMYLYAFIVDGQVIDTKRMILLK